MLCFCFVQNIFKTFMFILWKLDKSVFTNCVSWKLFEQFVKKRSIQESLLWFIKQVCSWTRFLQMINTAEIFTIFLSDFRVKVSYQNNSIILCRIMIYYSSEIVQMIDYVGCHRITWANNMSFCLMNVDFCC